MTLAVALSACGHPLKDGTWAISTDGAPVTDACALVPDGGATWSAALSTSGEEIYLALTLPVPGGTTEVDHLVGFFKTAEYGQDDGFLADATEMQIATPLPSVVGGCTSDTLTSHLDADTPDDTHFTGLLTLDYALTPPPDPDPCAMYTRCELQVHVKAALQQ